MESNLPWGPKGKSPWVNLEGGGEAMGDSQFIVEELTRLEKVSYSVTGQFAQKFDFFLNLYTNTVVNGSVTLSVRPFAIETTFPLSNLKTKHIFGILMIQWM